MSARRYLPRPRELFLLLPVGLLVLGSLRFLGHRGPWRGPGGMPDGLDQVVVVGPSGYVLAALAVLAVALRRTPRAGYLLAAVATSAYLAAGNPFGPILVTVAITAYALAREVPGRSTALVGGAGAALLLAATVLRGDPGTALLGAVPLLAWVVVPVSAGLARRLHLETRTRRREEEQRRALDEERMRLASEVHDVVGHGLAAIQLQADVALHLADRRPEQAREALAVISRASAEALAELRATLAQIAPATAAAEAHAPTPGLDRLEDLCDRMRDAGTAITLERAGERRPLTPAADVAAYRIVQESLTNVARHAPQARARVHLAYGERGVEVTVTSPITPGTEIIPGFGIAGMRRRAQAAGGTLSLTADGAELRVAAALPYAP